MGSGGSERGGANSITAVSVLIDGTQAGTATYGVARPDVCAALPGRPGCPNVGWSYSLNIGSLSPGTHTLTVVATDVASVTGSRQVTFTVAGVAPYVDIDIPFANATLSGTVEISGWALEGLNGVGANAIAGVAVLVDNVQVGTAAYGSSRPDVCAVLPGRPGCPNVGWSYSLNVSGLASGGHVLKIVATDTQGTSGSAQVSFGK